MDDAEDYYAKSLGIYPEYVSEFGLAKIILSKDDINRGSVLINYLILKYGDRALMHMASDPDFIHYRKYATSAKQSIISRFKSNIKNVISELEINLSKLHAILREFQGARSKALANKISEISALMEDIIGLNNVSEMPTIEDDVDLSPFFTMRELIKGVGKELYSEKSRILNLISNKKSSWVVKNSSDLSANQQRSGLIKSLSRFFGNPMIKESKGATGHEVVMPLENVQFDESGIENDLKLYLDKINNMIDIYDSINVAANKIIITYRTKKYNIADHNDLISDVLWKFPRKF